MKKNELANKKARKQTKLPLSTKATSHKILSNGKQKIRKMKNNIWQLE